MADPKFGDELTPLEIYTLERVARGLNNKTIARMDRCGRTAITNRLWRARVKMGTPNLIVTLFTAYRQGLFKLEEDDGRAVHDVSRSGVSGVREVRGNGQNPHGGHVWDSSHEGGAQLGLW
jgi:DNA-binding CsgD family transcriptional regulator